MGLLDTAAQNDAEYLVNDDVFGESVTYTARGGSPVAYKAVVDRRPDEPMDGQTNGLAHSLVISLRRDSAGTVGPVNARPGDVVSVKVQVGDSAARSLSVVSVDENDNAMWVLHCR